MAEDRNNIDKDETKINSENNQSMGNPSNSNQSNDDEYEKICSICRRPESKAGKMIQMGMGMYVCPDCMQRSMDTIMKGDFNYDEMMKLSKDMPGIHFMNMSDLMGDIPQKQRLRKRRRVRRRFLSSTSRIFRHLTRLRRSLMSMSLVRSTLRRLSPSLFTTITRGLRQTRWIP